jgi:hypothetical protein
MAPETHNAEADIFDVPAENLVGGGGGEAYKAKDGVHPAQIVAIVDMGDVHNKHFDKTQRKGIFVFALGDQTVCFKEEDGSEKKTDEPITVCSDPITIGNGCFDEKAKLFKMFGSLGIKVDAKKTKISDLLGMNTLIFTKRDDEGKYVKINSINPPMEGQLVPQKPVYLPNYLLVDKDGTPKGYKIRTVANLVIDGVRPKHEEKKA